MSTQGPSDPSITPRRLDAGYKGDAWSVSLPRDASDVVLVLDTGLDSVTITRIPDAVWDRGTGHRTVHVHDGYDEAVLVQRGSGTLSHGPDPAHISTHRFSGPVVLVLPAGTWHGVTMDPDVDAEGTAFYTVPGTVIAPFADQMASVTRGQVRFEDLPVVETLVVEAGIWPSGQADPASAPVDPDPQGAAEGRVAEGRVAHGTDVGTDGLLARVLPYEAPDAGYVLPLDTGRDSLFILASHDRPDPEQGPFVAPEVLDLHRHAEVDEYIIRAGGAGWIVNGATPDTVALTPFRGPCLLVMPAGALHRVLQTEPSAGDGILIYADRHAVVEPYAVIMARTTVAAVTGPHQEVSRS